MFIQGIFQTHHPTWDNIKAMLPLLMSEVEINGMVTKAGEEVGRRYWANPANYPQVQDAFPWDRPPQWDYNNVAGRMCLEEFRLLVLHGLRASIVQQDNWSKVQEVWQEEKKPAQHSCSAYTML